MSVPIESHGISTTIPSGWDGRVVTRPQPDPDALQSHERARSHGIADGQGGTQFPIIHLGNFALPSNRGDYGSGAVDIMSSRHMLIVLSEFGPESVGTALFSAQGIPQTLSPQPFSANALQRKLPGQLGYQHFFTHSGRAFALFVVLGGRRHAAALCEQGSQILSSTRIAPR